MKMFLVTINLLFGSILVALHLYIFKLCRQSTEKISISILATLASMCEAGFWPTDLKLFLKVVLGYGTFDFEGDF